MFTPDQILEIAQSLQPRLHDLLPIDRASAIDEQLTELIARFNTGEDVSQEILDLLDEQPELQPHLSIGTSKQYNPLAGSGKPIAYPRFKCPDCNYTWSQLEASDAIPPCSKNPNHQALQPL